MFYDNIGFDTRLAEDLLSFRNNTDLETGIEKTIRWYKNKNLL
jgi:dTDP-D-glucose 4,6-dehydratase